MGIKSLLLLLHPRLRSGQAPGGGIYPSLSKSGKGRFFNNDTLLMHFLVIPEISDRRLSLRAGRSNLAFYYRDCHKTFGFLQLQRNQPIYGSISELGLICPYCLNPITFVKFFISSRIKILHQPVLSNLLVL